MAPWDWQRLETTSVAQSVWVGGVQITPGDRVRLCPRQGRDILDLALAGHIAVVASIEQDYEDKIYLAVVLDIDPGRDLGFLRQPGHRFFFMPEEVEPLQAQPAQQKDL